MRLATFIRNNQEAILQEWDRFAAGLVSAPAGMKAGELRDHAAGMLDVIATTLEQSEAQRAAEKQRDKSTDRTSADAHGSDRMRQGFDVGDMVAEFRALRASVIHLWSQQTARMDRDDILTFDTAIDEALAESIAAYSMHKEKQTRLLEGMLSYSSDQCAIFDADANILFANRALARAYAMRVDELEGKPVDVLGPSFAEEVRTQMQNVWETGHEYRGDFTMTLTNGDVHVIDFLFAPILDKDDRVEAVAVNSRDISERRELERTLWQHANHDHLTGLPNRRLFFDRLEQDMLLTRRLGGILAVFYMDLDKFKQANDRLGHEGGDDLLQQAARRIASCIRETDTAARMGGDEFTVILMRPGDRRHVEAVARAILAKLERPFRAGNESVDLAGSIGIAIYPDNADTMSELTALADEAMYIAKSEGGNRYHFHMPDDAPQPTGTRRLRAPDSRDTRH